MGKFTEWLKDEEGHRKAKLVAMRRWLWNQEHGEHQGNPPPVSDGDPDYLWVKKKIARLGALDPYTYGENTPNRQ
jgi:hypothetical protein